MKRAGVVLASLGLLIAQPALADHCTTYSTSTTDLRAGGAIVVAIDPPGANSAFYLVWDLCQPDCIFSEWVYQESTGHPGLQRGDSVVTDTCHDMIRPDTVAV